MLIRSHTEGMDVPPTPTLHESHALLRALEPGVKPYEFSLTSEPCLIGRHIDCQVVISRLSVSRTHARIERRGALFVLIDAGSANGTYVNGARLHAEHLLRNHDQIGLASQQALLQFIDQDATDIQPQRLQFLAHEQRFVFLGVPLALSPNLQRLLLHLYQQKGELCSHESCVRAIWPNEKYDPARIELLHREISELRQKLQAISPQATSVIKLHRGFGYRLDLDS